MARRFFGYLIVVLIFGTLKGFSHSQSSESALRQPFIEGYVFHALLWGTIFFNGVIQDLKISIRSKCFLTFAVAITAGLGAYFYYLTFGRGEVLENVLAGWGNDISTYKEYPIKGYEAIGTVIFGLYLITGFAMWFFSLIPNQKES